MAAEAFTPPRDDFGLGPPITEHDDVPKSGAGIVASRQAVCLVLKGLLCVFSLVVSFGICYSFLGMFIHRPVLYVCNEQAIFNGYFLPGMKGSEPTLKCAHGWMPQKGYGTNVTLTCRLVHEECVITKKATVILAAVKKCNRSYAFVSAEIAKDSLLNGSYTVEQVIMQEQFAIPEACIVKPKKKKKKGHETTLYSQQVTPSLPSPMQAGYIALVSTIFLSVCALLVLVAVHGVSIRERREGFRPLSGHSPPSAALDVEDAEDVWCEQDAEDECE